MKTLRLFALLDQLRLARRPVSAEVLARRLGVSSRTIYRDVVHLQELGAPVRGESGLGYQLEKGYFLPPLKFDADEMEAIMLGLRLVMARNSSAEGLYGAAERVSGKIAAVIGADEGEKFRSLPLLAVTRERESDDRAAKWIDILRKLIRMRRIVVLTYRTLAGTESCRRVHPLGLTLFDEVWLLTAWCESREDFRNFRLDLIAGIAETDESFHSQNGRRFNDYLATL